MNTILKIYQYLFMDKRDIEFAEQLRESTVKYHIYSGVIVVEDLHNREDVKESFAKASRLIKRQNGELK